MDTTIYACENCYEVTASVAEGRGHMADNSGHAMKVFRVKGTAQTAPTHFKMEIESLLGMGLGRVFGSPADVVRDSAQEWAGIKKVAHRL